MARYMGEVQSGSKTVSRLGTEKLGLETRARSYQGTIIVKFFAIGDQDHVVIQVAEGSSGVGDKVLYRGLVSALVENEVIITVNGQALEKDA